MHFINNIRSNKIQEGKRGSKYPKEERSAQDELKDKLISQSQRFRDEGGRF